MLVKRFRCSKTARRFCGSLLFLFILLGPLGLFGQKSKARSAKGKGVQSHQAAPAELLWPLPPEKPRVKYLGLLSNNTDVEPPKKKGWLQKLINEEDTQRVLGMTRPAGVAVDSQDRIYVADSLKSAVFVFDLKNKTLNLLGAEGRGKLGVPYGVAIDKNDNAYVSDTKLHRVNVYNRDWQLTAALSRIGNQKLVNPAGLAVDEARNRLLVVDSQGHQVFVFDLQQLEKGTFFGKRGEGDDEFNYPNSIAVDKDGTIYVSDTLNFCVKVFTKDFRFVRKIGQHGTGFGMFDRPKGLALDSEGHLYVVDSSFSNFQIFTREGRLLLFVGGFGTEPGTFRLPAGIFIDLKDRIFVTDQVNSRVQMFQFLGGQ